MEAKDYTGRQFHALDSAGRLCKGTYTVTAARYSHVYSGLVLEFVDLQGRGNAISIKEVVFI